MKSAKPAASKRLDTSNHSVTATPTPAPSGTPNANRTGIDLLTRLGFSKVGEWSLGANKPQVALRLLAEARQVIYAFVRENEVLYVARTARSLRARMRSYEQPGPAQRTNKRINGCLAASLIDGRPVHVHALAKWDGTAYRGVALNIAAGLEDPLISLLQPAWNVTESVKE